MRLTLLALALLTACSIKKNVKSNIYSRPPLDFHDTDEDIEYLPEAGEIKGDDRDETNKDTAEENDPE